MITYEPFWDADLLEERSLTIDFGDYEMSFE